MKNQDIREEIKKAGVKLWMIADSLKMAEATFLKKLRYELPYEEKEKIRSIIAEIKQEGV